MWEGRSKGFRISSCCYKDYEVTLARYKEHKNNMEVKSTAQIYKDLLGQTGKPQAKLHPIIDATHMTVNWGGCVFKPIYNHEAANSKIWLTGTTLKKKNLQRVLTKFQTKDRASDPANGRWQLCKKTDGRLHCNCINCVKELKMMTGGGRYGISTTIQSDATSLVLQ